MKVVYSNLSGQRVVREFSDWRELWTFVSRRLLWRSVEQLAEEVL